MKPDTAISIAILAVVGTLLFVVIRKLDFDFGPTADDPTGNIVSRGFDELITLGTADKGFSLGGLAFDIVQFFKGEEPFDPNAPVEVTEEELEFIDFASIPKKRGPVIFTPPSSGA